MNITLDEATELIQAKREADKKKIIKEFEGEDLRVLNGRFGPYISYKGNNYKIPKTQKPEELTLEGCHALIDKQGEKPEKVKRGAKKAVAKKVIAGKAATKKATTTKKTATKKKASTAK